MSCNRLYLPIIMLLLTATATSAQPSADKADPDKKELDRASLEKQFEKTLSGVTLVGRFVIEGEDDGAMKEEKYTISKVTKLQGDYWLFQVRIQYGGHDVTLPLPLRVKWAGDTPVITVTDAAIPGLGTYTARVVIYRGKYAGTWSSKDHGGQLFGKIVKNKPEKPKEEKKEEGK